MAIIVNLDEKREENLKPSLDRLFDLTQADIETVNAVIMKQMQSLLKVYQQKTELL